MPTTNTVGNKYGRGTVIMPGFTSSGSITLNCLPPRGEVEIVVMRDPVLEQLLMEKLAIYLESRWGATSVRCLHVHHIKNHERYKFKVDYELLNGKYLGKRFSTWISPQGKICT